jgi:hypothetical protein
VRHSRCMGASWISRRRNVLNLGSASRGREGPFQLGALMYATHSDTSFEINSSATSRNPDPGNRSPIRFRNCLSVSPIFASSSAR